jgi:putative RNA 2'-phosphotransferase
MSAGRYLSYVLRHRPDELGLVLQSGGWVGVEELLGAMADAGRPLSRQGLERVVADDGKGCFSFDEGGDRIRANQGHSVDVDLELEPVAPPEVLFHGTVKRFLASIHDLGLVRGSRHHVHLSADRETATTVGSRRGRPVLLTVDAAAMAQEGHVFFRSANGVWLVEQVPSR